MTQMPKIADSTINALNALSDIRTDLQEAFGRDKRGKGFICPECGNGSGSDGDGVTLYEKNHTWKCFKCGTNHGAVKWLYEYAWKDRPFYDSVKELCDLHGVNTSYEAVDTPRTHDTPKNDKSHAESETNQSRGILERTGDFQQADNTEYYRYCRNHLAETDYHRERGLSDEVCERHWVGYDPQKKALVIPNSRSSYFLRFVDKATDEKGKVWNPPGISMSLFNKKILGTTEKPVFIVEGAIDAMSIETLGGCAVALNSTSNTGLLVNALQEIKQKPLLIIALDDDEAGRKAGERLKRELDRISADSILCNIYPEGCKDANCLLCNKPEALQEIVSRSMREWQKERLWASSNAAYIDSIYSRFVKAQKYYPTGFKNLDKLLGGGLTSGLIVLGAVSSLGKTTFILQVCDQLARAGSHVLYFSLEMSRSDLVAKSFSRISHEIITSGEIPQNFQPLDVRSVISLYPKMSDESQLVMECAKTKYLEYCANIHTDAEVGDLSIDDVERRTAEFISITGEKPVIMIDYLQIMKPVLERATEKQEIDQAVKRLKLLSEKFDVPVIAISSFNRANYNEPVNTTAFKESGAVEYSSDVLIGLQYEYMAYHKDSAGEWESEKDRIKRIREAEIQSIRNANLGKSIEVECKVLKNRIGTKGSCYFELYPKYNRFIPVDDFKKGEAIKDEANPFLDPPAKKKNTKKSKADDYVGKSFKDPNNVVWTGIKNGTRVYMKNTSDSTLMELDKWLNLYKI